MDDETPATTWDEILFIDSVAAALDAYNTSLCVLEVETFRQLDELREAFAAVMNRFAYHVDHSLSYAAREGSSRGAEEAIERLLAKEE